MKKFRIKTYEITSPKIKNKKGARFAVIADMHGLVFGKNNETLLKAVKDGKPDAVFVAGDMFVRMELSTMKQAKELLKALALQFPVYYALGNHEYNVYLSEENRESYLEYERELSESGVIFLHNEKAQMKIQGTSYWIHGLELPMEYYHKPTSPKLSLREMENLVGVPKEEGIHVLIAHNPKYGRTYFSWGADLIVSGHYHGGVVRLSENHGLTSPQFLLLPPYCCGHFKNGSRHMIVSAGMGEHTIPVRIHNPRELLLITMKPLEKS